MGKVKKQVEKYEKKMEDHKNHDHDHKPKRKGNAWTAFVSQRYHDMKNLNRI